MSGAALVTQGGQRQESIISKGGGAPPKKFPYQDLRRLPAPSPREKKAEPCGGEKKGGTGEKTFWPHCKGGGFGGKIDLTNQKEMNARPNCGRTGQEEKTKNPFAFKMVRLDRKKQSNEHLPMRKKEKG